MLAQLLFLAATAIASTSAPIHSPAPSPAAVDERLVDIGGARLYLRCQGDVGPTVIIDVGAGHWSVHYRHIQAALAPHVRTCLYDRAGYGRSDAVEGERTSSQMADELHRLVHAAGLEPPFVLAGHSLGGYTVRVYQRRYASEVSAMVLIDAAHPEQWQRLPPVAHQLVLAAVPGLRATAEAVADGHLDRSQLSPWPETMDPLARDDYEEAMLSPATYRTHAAELEGAAASAAAVTFGTLGDLPLVVVTAGRSFDAFAGTGIPVEEANSSWLQMQAELVGLSRDAQQLISEHGTHDLGATDPGIVVAGIRLAADEARVGPERGPLPIDPQHRLPERSTPEVDRMLTAIEEAYRSMDAERFVGRFAPDVEQLDVNRKVLVQGAEAWLEKTRSLNAAHRWMERIHHGRMLLGNRLVVEVEWAGLVRGEALGRADDVEYRYTGVGILELADGKVRRQLFYDDAGTLFHQLGQSAPKTWATASQH